MMRNGVCIVAALVTAFLALAVVGETRAADGDPPASDAQPPGATTLIPDGYLRIQAPPEWRGQSMDWYLIQAKIMYGEFTPDSGNALTGVAVVDRDAGDILALFDASTLATP